MSQKLEYLNKLDKHINLILGCLFLTLLNFACAGDRLGGDWTVPTSQLAEGEGNGDIPAINRPKYTQASDVNFLEDSSLVIGIKIESTIKAYPIEIMDWHEVVNDNFDTIPIAVTYSALSGSSIALGRRIQKENSTEKITLEFRVSGLLYNSNTIFNDFQTISDWSQILRKGIRGDYSDRTLIDFPMFEMNWGKWRQLFPDSKVLNRNTGYNRPYGTYPYGDYRTDSTDILFDLPLDIDSLNEIHNLKEKMLGVIGNQTVKGYRLANFDEPEFSLIEDEIDGEPILIIGNRENRFFVAYSAKTADGISHKFSLKILDNKVLLEDEMGNQFNIFGESIENPDNHLNRLESNIAYWFSWASFYPNIEIYE